MFEDGVDFDLMYKQITFTPSSDGSGYTYATTTVSALADLPSSAAVDLDLGDDDYSQVGLPLGFLVLRRGLRVVLRGLERLHHVRRG